MKTPAKTTTLPPWLTRDAKGVFHIDPDEAYPVILDTLGFTGKPDQYSLEVAYQVAKMKTQDVAMGMGWKPEEEALLILVDPKDSASKKKWALVNYPPGRGVDRATRGLEARGHYARIRHLL